jgi:hypothetical protein
MTNARCCLSLLIIGTLLIAGCRREVVETTRGEEPSAPVTATTTAPPQDLSNARVNTVIPPADGIFLDKAALGSTLGQDGMVADEKNEFAAGQPAYLSMWFRESPDGLQSSIIIQDRRGKEVYTTRRAMNGRKMVTFALGEAKLKPGQYKAIGYWGGNVAAEYDFRVK